MMIKSTNNLFLDQDKLQPASGNFIQFLLNKRIENFELCTKKVAVTVAVTFYIQILYPLTAV